MTMDARTQSITLSRPSGSGRELLKVIVVYGLLRPFETKILFHLSRIRTRR